MSCLREIAFLKAKDVLETNCPNISRSESVSKVVSLLTSSESYEAIVINSELNGVVTVRDTLKILNPERTSVARILFKPPSMGSDTPLYDVASALISNRIRIIPIVDNGSISGVVRQKAVLKRMVDCPDLQEFLAEDLMVSNPVTVDLDSSASIVRNLMLSQGISHAPVVDKNGELEGIITANDLVWNLFRTRDRVTVGERKGEKERLLRVSIKGVVDRHPLDVTPRTKVTEVVREMVTQDKGYCLVIEKRKPVGILTPRDIISVLSDFKPRIHIPLYIFGLKGEDEDQIELAKRKIERAASRGLKMHPDLLEIVIHGKVSKVEGSKRKYTLRARAITPKETLAANATGWDLPGVFDVIADRINKRLKQVKPSARRQRRIRVREQLVV